MIEVKKYEIFSSYTPGGLVWFVRMVNKAGEIFLIPEKGFPSEKEAHKWIKENIKKEDQ